MTLSQNSTSRSGSKISFTATVHTHWEAASSNREAEFRHLVVRELRWYAEEIVRIISQPSSSDEKFSIRERQLIRKLCDGGRKGYWGFSCNPYVKQPNGKNLCGKGEEKSATCIPFEFSIPKQAKIVNEIDPAAYEICADRGRPYFTMSS